MRKILIGIICGACIFCATGCGNNSKATVTANDGGEAEMTAKELIKLYGENETKFNLVYLKAKIELTEVYDSVFKQGEVTCLKFKNNFVVAYHESKGEFIDFVSGLDKGDKVHFTGSIRGINEYCGGGTNGVDLVELSVSANSIFEKTK